MKGDAGTPRQRGESLHSGSVPAGGPSNINGVLYQMLWCLLRALEIHIRVDERDPDGQPTRALLRLEPRGGGDVQELTAASRRVIQLKSRSTGRTWSLTEIVNQVFPDLYRAVDLSSGDASYDFVTEAEIGDWAAAHEFFRSLKARAPTSDMLAGLDDEKKVRFARGWELATEKEFFEKIVGRLRAANETVSADETRRKVWHLLAHFNFIGAQELDGIRRDIDSLLLALVDRKEQLAEKRGALLEDLANNAAKGDATVATDDLLAKFGLAVVPLTEWAELRARSRREFKSALELREYDATLDVRSAAARELAQTVVCRWARNPGFLRRKR